MSSRRIPLFDNPYEPSDAPSGCSLSNAAQMAAMAKRPPTVLVTQILIFMSLGVNTWGLGIFAFSIPAFLVTQTPLTPVLISLILPVLMLIGFAFLLWGLCVRQGWSRWGGAAFYLILLISVTINIYQGTPAHPDPITANIPGIDFGHPLVVAARWGAHFLVLVLAFLMLGHWLFSPRLRYWYALAREEAEEDAARAAY